MSYTRCKDWMMDEKDFKSSTSDWLRCINAMYEEIKSVPMYNRIKVKRDKSYFASDIIVLLWCPTEENPLKNILLVKQQKITHNPFVEEAVKGSTEKGIISLFYNKKHRRNKRSVIYSMFLVFIDEWNISL